MMLHIKYQGSRPCGFRKEYLFSCFLFIILCKTCDPTMGPYLNIRLKLVSFSGGNLFLIKQR